MQKRFCALHDKKAAKSHFNMLSVFHLPLRGSDPQGALYWMARMIEGGEDPMTIFRRSIAMAAEDIGLADPQGITVGRCRPRYLPLRWGRRKATYRWRRW